MKITKTHLKQIIKEELEATIQEGRLQDKLHAIQDSGAWEEFKEFMIDYGYEIKDALTFFDADNRNYKDRLDAEKKRKRARMKRIAARGGPNPTAGKRE